MRIDDERDVHEQLEAAFEAITPRPAPVDGAVRRGRASRVRRQVAVAAGAAAVAAIGVFAVPSLLHQIASPAPVSAARPYTVTVQAPGPHSAPGLIASGTIDGQSWQVTAAKPGAGGAGPGGQIFTTSGPAFGGRRAPSPAPRWPWTARILSPSLTWCSPAGPFRSSTARSGRCDVCRGAAGQRIR